MLWLAAAMRSAAIARKSDISDMTTGAGVTLSVVGGAKPSPASGSKQQSDEQQFVATTTPQTGSWPIYNRRRGMPALGDSPGSSQPSSSVGYRPADYLTGQHSEFVQPPGGQQKKDEFVVKTGGGLIPPPVPAVETGGFVATRPSRPPDYVLAEEEARRAASAGTYSTALDAATQTSSGYRPADYVVNQRGRRRRWRRKRRSLPKRRGPGFPGRWRYDPRGGARLRGLRLVASGVRQVPRRRLQRRRCIRLSLRPLHSRQPLLRQGALRPRRRRPRRRLHRLRRIHRRPPPLAVGAAPALTRACRTPSATCPSGHGT